MGTKTIFSITRTMLIPRGYLQFKHDPLGFLEPTLWI